MKKLDRKEKNAICETLRTVLDRNGIASFKIEDSDLISLDQSPILYFDPCPFKKFFYKKHATKMINLFAYKKAQRVYDMLVTNELHLTSLKLNEKNDSSEYSEALLRIGYLHPFIPSDYCSRENNCAKAKNQIWFDGVLPIDKQRENIYIYCFTNEFNKKRHWFEYADECSGVCVEYDLDISQLLQFSGFCYGRIHYDEGYDFDFIKEIIHHVRVEHGKMLQPLGLTRMAMLYKRDKYRWEDESRLAFNLNNDSSFGSTVKHLIEANPQWFEKTTDGVLKIKGTDNPYIKWKIKRVICGDRIDCKTYKKIGALCKKQAIEFI